MASTAKFILPISQAQAIPEIIVLVNPKRAA